MVAGTFSAFKFKSIIPWSFWHLDLSETYLHVCLHLDKFTAAASSMTKPALNRHTKSDNGNSYHLPQKFKRKSSKQAEQLQSTNRLPVWIVNNSKLRKKIWSGLRLSAYKVNFNVAIFVTYWFKYNSNNNATF